MKITGEIDELTGGVRTDMLEYYDGSVIRTRPHPLIQRGYKFRFGKYNNAYALSAFAPHAYHDTNCKTSLTRGVLPEVDMFPEVFVIQLDSITERADEQQFLIEYLEGEVRRKDEYRAEALIFRSVKHIIIEPDFLLLNTMSNNLSFMLSYYDMDDRGGVFIPEGTARRYEGLYPMPFYGARNAYLWGD